MADNTIFELIFNFGFYNVVIEILVNLDTKKLSEAFLTNKYEKLDMSEVYEMKISPFANVWCYFEGDELESP